MKVNQLVSNSKPSATMALNQKAQEILLQGKDLVNLTAGEPDFVTPDYIRKYAQKAMDQGKTFYSPAAGIKVLRETIAEKATQRFGREITFDQVIVTCGAKQAVFSVCFSMLEPGDEVIMITPFWVSYSESVRLCGGVPVFVQTNIAQNFTPDIKDIEDKITDRTRLIILNSPTNPTGLCYSNEFIRDLDELMKKHVQINILTDEIYGELIYEEGSAPSFAKESRLDFDRILIVDGVSKTYSMTGWRVGWAIADKNFAKGMTSVQSQMNSGTSTVSQWAAVSALTTKDPQIEEMRDRFKERRNFVFESISGIRELRVQKPSGAFYIFPCIDEVLESSKANENGGNG